MTAAEQVRALAESGTPGPWVSEKWEIRGHQGNIATARKPQNAAKIVAAVNALGPLADLIEALEQDHHPLDCEAHCRIPCPVAAASDALLDALGVTE